eukprot:RCo040845
MGSRVSEMLWSEPTMDYSLDSARPASPRPSIVPQLPLERNQQGRLKRRLILSSLHTRIPRPPRTLPLSSSRPPPARIEVSASVPLEGSASTALEGSSSLSVLEGETA